MQELEFPPTRVADRGRGWYRGDCHVHSVYSHGKLTPEQLAAGARAAGLDFIATTEHNTADAHGAWGAYAGDDLLVILGEEVTTQTGHWLALGIQPGQLVDWRYRVRDDTVGRRWGTATLIWRTSEPAVVLAEVRGVPSGAVSFHTDRGAVHRASLPGSGSGAVEWRTSAEESQFVRSEVRRPAGRMAALSNPILLT